MDQAYLSREACAKDRENPRGLQQNVPEARHVLGVVGSVYEVVLEWDGVRDLDGHVPDTHRGSKAVERRHDLLVKRGNGHWFEWDGFAAAVTGLQQEHVLNEVEVD